MNQCRRAANCSPFDCQRPKCYGPSKADLLTDALEDALEFIDGYVDVNDGDYGIPEPNRAMVLAARIRDAMETAKGKT